MRILEVGIGYTPASRQGGSLFADREFDYYGIDVDISGARTSPNPEGIFIEADFTSLPFPDGTFDQILMRNFFGQFCDGYISPAIANRVINGGLTEAFRVLKQLGCIAIVEENTPMPASDVQYFLEEHGLTVTKSETMRYNLDNLGTDNPWRRLRGIYFDDTPVQTEPDDWRGEPNVVVAVK